MDEMIDVLIDTSAYLNDVLYNTKLNDNSSTGSGSSI